MTNQILINPGVQFEQQMVDRFFPLINRWAEYFGALASRDTARVDTGELKHRLICVAAVRLATAFHDEWITEIDVSELVRGAMEKSVRVHGTILAPFDDEHGFSSNTEIQCFYGGRGGAEYSRWSPTNYAALVYEVERAPKLFGLFRSGIEIRTILKGRDSLVDTLHRREAYGQLRAFASAYLAAIAGHVGSLTAGIFFRDTGHIQPTLLKVGLVLFLKNDEFYPSSFNRAFALIAPAGLKTDEIDSSVAASPGATTIVIDCGGPSKAALPAGAVSREKRVVLRMAGATFEAVDVLDQEAVLGIIASKLTDESELTLALNTLLGIRAIEQKDKRRCSRYVFVVAPSANPSKDLVDLPRVVDSLQRSLKEAGAVLLELASRDASSGKFSTELSHLLNEHPVEIKPKTQSVMTDRKGNQFREPDPFFLPPFFNQT